MPPISSMPGPPCPGGPASSSFGASVTTDTYAADALRAVAGIMRAAEEWGAERGGAGKPVLSVGAAVASGRITFGAVGDETRLEYTVIGEAVNLAAKLEKHNKAEGVRAMTTVAAFVFGLGALALVFYRARTASAPA